jgi:hypothetical protein
MSDVTLKSVAEENQHLTGGILVANRYTSRGYQMSTRVSI